MVKDFLELAIINGYTQDEPLLYLPKHPFTLLNTNRLLVKVIGLQKKYLKNSKRPYREVMRNMHLPYSKTADVFFNRNIPIVNRQNRLALYIALSAFTLDIIFLCGNKGIKRNLGVISRLKIGHDRMRSGNILETLNIGMYKDVLDLNFDMLYNIVKNKEL